MCYRFKELVHVFKSSGQQEGTSYALLNPARFLSGDEPSCKRETVDYLQMIKRVCTTKDHDGELRAHHTGNEIFRSLHDPDFEGSIEERLQEVASGVQGALVGSAMNTVCLPCNVLLRRGK